MTDCGCELEAEGDAQRTTLRVVLAINAAMFVVEIVAGVLASSTGLIADSLDMLADATLCSSSSRFWGMLGFGIAALIANITYLILLAKHRRGEDLIRTNFRLAFQPF